MAGMEKFLGFADFGALQMAHFGRQALDRAGDDAQRREIGGVAVARDDLSGDGFSGEAEFFGDIGFDARVDMGERADGAGNGAGGDFGAGGQQARLVAGEFGVVTGEF